MIETFDFDKKRSELVARFTSLKFRAEHVCDLVVDNEIDRALELIEESNNILLAFEYGLDFGIIEVMIQDFEEVIKRFESELGIAY